MKRLILLLFFATGLAYGQYTSITASVKDANQVPYANGRVSVTLPQGEVFIGTGLQPPNSGSAQMDSTGTFSLRLASNDQLSPSGSKWTFNICNSVGTTCFSSQQTITGTSQSLSSALSTASTLLPVPTDSVREFLLQTAPANPPSGFVLLYADSGTGNMTCLTSAGASCLSGGGGGGGATFQVNGVNTANQTTINFLDSAAANGLTLGFTNPSVGQVKLVLSGTLANTGLANSSVTVNTTSPLAGGGALALGGTLTLTCTICATSANNLGFFASTTSAQFAGVITDETGTGHVVFDTSPTFITQIKSPIYVTGAADPADTGAFRLGNTETMAWEKATPGTDWTLGVDASDILQSTANFNAPVITENSNAVPNSTDNLGFFAATTSAQFLGVISNETGTGLVVANNTPSLTTPVISNTTVGSLGAAGTLGRIAIVTDGVDKADCTSGGGSAKLVCIDTGTVWTSASGAGATGANVALSNLASVAVNASLIAGADNTIDIGSNTTKWRTGYFGTSVIAPSFASSGSNGGIDALEGTGAGLTPAASHDLLWADSTAHRWKVNNNNGTTTTIAYFADNLSVFASTTSAQFSGVISDETGTGHVVFDTAPTFITSITSPVFISGAADPADAGAIRLGNAENIAWEANPTGTDLTLTVNSSNVFSLSAPLSVTTGFQIGGAATTGHFLRGNGTNYVDNTIQASDIPAALSSSTSVNGTTIPSGGVTLSQTVASGTSALGTGAISSATCATVVTTTATGTATTDVVWWGFNGDPTAVTGYVPLTAGMLTIVSYPSTNNVNFKVCNNTSSSITPGAITLNWRIVR